MAKSLDGLIRHLVDQIALCGEQGALPVDFIAHVKSYYVETVEDNQSLDRQDAIPHPDITFTVDRPFLEQVWKWLVKNPEIRLGSHAGHKQLTLSEVEAHNAAIKQPEQAITISQNTNHSETGASSHADNALTIVPDGDTTQTQQIAETAGAEATDAAIPQDSKSNPGIRLYASENRMWHALAGHGPDLSKIKSFDFACLSIIAACGPKGILQNDLIRISGQDKRSLPARTDRLRNGGYVEKTNVCVQLSNPTRALHTSRCTLKRFVKSNVDQEQQRSDTGPAPTKKRKRANKKSQKDQDSQTQGPSSSTVGSESVAGKETLTGSRAIPSWTADRSLNSQIFELVDRAGIKGMSMANIRDNLMGDHIRRPIDEYVLRMADSWQLSQPLHLRHLSLVRDTVLKGKTQTFIYYTFENFKRLVEGGTAFWEAVQTIPSEVTRGKNVAAALDAKPDVDEYGFPILEENRFQGRQNDATLEQCVSALEIDPLHIAARDPVLRKQAKSSHGIRNKGHQQHSVTIGNTSSPKKAASTLSQTASTKARVTEPQNVALSTSFGEMSTTTQVPEPEKVVVSKAPRGVPAEVQKLCLQTQRRKHIRKLDPKPLGRPRKYPKTGLPANFDTLTPDEVEDLHRSQEMFEKYEITKVEKEILQRVEDGEDAVVVAYEVLEERDKSREQEGDLPLPKASRAKILHRFAGEPTPEPDPGADVNPERAKPKGRRRKDPRYQPSIAAHTYFVPALRKQASPKAIDADSEIITPIIPTRTRKRGQRMSGLEPTIYLPSVAADSRPYIRQHSLVMDISTADTLQSTVKRKGGRPAKPKQLLDPQSKSTPSIAAHSVTPNTVTIARTGQKRKRAASVSLENDEERTTPHEYKYLPSIAAHSGSFLPPDGLDVVRGGQKRKRAAHSFSQPSEHHTTSSASSAATPNPFTEPSRGASQARPDMQLHASSEGMYPGWEKFMSKYYQQQLETIPRTNVGVFIGKTTPRRKRPCEPRDFRPTHFKLAVFKSTRLSDLNWFVKEVAASEQSSRLGSRTQTPMPQVAESAFKPYTQSMSEGQPEISGPTILPSSASSDSSCPPTSTYVSPYADVAGTKRKRTTSPQPTRGPAPFDPFSASLYSRHSSPTAKSFPPTSKPSKLSEMEALSPAIDQVHENSIIDDQAPVGTPETHPDTKDSGELIHDGSVLDDSKTMQSEVAASHDTQTSKSSTRKASRISNRQSINKISRRGGSTAVLRKNIIMDIVDKCEGVFPSHREMSLPFAAEWKRRGQEGTPEVKTISNAVNALITEKRLRQITFTAQTKHGITVTKNMLTLPTIETTDPKVKDTQTNMVAYHPRNFVPLAVLPSRDYQSTEVRNNKINGQEAIGKTTEKTLQDLSELEPAELRRLDLAKKSMDGKDKAAMARLRALKGEDQQDAPSPGTKKLSKPTSKRPDGRRGQKRVERLASIKKPARSQLSPLETTAANPVSKSDSLLWLPSHYAFSDINYEGRRPTVHIAAAENDMRLGTLEAPVPLDSSDQARQRIRKMAENAALIERKQALVNSTRPSLPYTNINASLSESPYAPVRDLGLKRVALEEMNQLPPTSNNMRRGSLSTTASPSSESPSSRVATWPALAHAEGLGTSSRQSLLVSFMDPVHYLHRPTGTFSVTFSGLRPPRKIIANCGTTLDPHAASIKTVQPCGSYRRYTRPPSLQNSGNTEKALFDEKVDVLLRRELEANELHDVHLMGWPFVNHVFSHAHETVEVVEADMEVAKQVTVSLKSGRLMSKPFSGKNDSRRRIDNSIFSTGSRGIDQAATETRKPLKRRRLTALVGKRTRDEASVPVELDQEQRPTKLRRLRGPRQAKPLGENGEKRLLTAVTVIRALTGGLDKRIDWVLVAKVFEPTYTQMFVHSRWNFTLQKYKLGLPKLESDFQSIFASAYEEGTVPAIDYDNLENYDWKWLVEWTMASIGTSTQSLPELPAERSEFDRLYTLDEMTTNQINEVYEIDGSSTLAKRTKVLHRDPYVLPLIRKRQGVQREDAQNLTIAKSWIRANIMTPESTYNPSVARAKLSTFPDHTVEDALKQLLLDRVLSQENKGRLVPGRNYDISDFLVSRLKKNLHPAHFHRAAAYKQQLDQDFQEKGFAKHSYAADDGDMMVIFNLQANQRIKIVPIDVPMNKWGQTDGGYETRQMDKRRLDFSLELRPSPTYMYGNPLHPLPAPPSQHLQDPMAKIPLWYDIHGGLVPIMWEMALAAVVAVLAVRPGVGASELEKVMRPAMEVWELQDVLEWLVIAKAAKKVGQGFSVADEWWWLALGTGEDGKEW